MFRVLGMYNFGGRSDSKFLQGSAVVFGGGLFVWWCLTIASRLVSWRGLRTRRAVSGGHLLS